MKDHTGKTKEAQRKIFLVTAVVVALAVALALRKSIAGGLLQETDDGVRCRVREAEQIERATNFHFSFGSRGCFRFHGRFVRGHRVPADRLPEIRIQTWSGRPSWFTELGQHR